MLTSNVSELSFVDENRAQPTVKVGELTNLSTLMLKADLGSIRALPMT